MSSVATPEIKREQFLEQRKSFIGGSDAASMFSEGWGCQRRLVYDKQGVPQDFGRTPRELAILERGTELEDVVCDLFQRKTGLQIWRQNKPAISRVTAHAGVNIDRKIVGATQEMLRELFGFTHPRFAQIVGEDPGPGVFEAKTTNEWSLKAMDNIDPMTNLPAGLPTDYVLQMEHALMVTGYKWGIFGILEPTWWQYRWFPVVSNEKLIAILREKVGETWGYVETNTLPERLTTADKRCKSCQWRRTCRTTEELAKLMGMSDEEMGDYEADDSAELVELAIDYKESLAILDEKKQIVETIEDRIKELLGDRTKVEVPAAGIKFCWKTSKGRSGWDTKALEAAQLSLSKVLDCVKKEAAEFVTKHPEITLLGDLIGKCRTVGAGSRPFKKFF